jgi:hypothetical protein
MLKTVVKMHYGLILYLNKELRKKRTLKELIYFLRDLVKRYYQVNVGEYKKLFLILDPEYIKQKTTFDKQNQIKKDLQRALKILHYVDMKMVKAGNSRQQRRQFWRDFYKDGQVRNDVFKDLDKEVG